MVVMIIIVMIVNEKKVSKAVFNLKIGWLRIVKLEKSVH